MRSLVIENGGWEVKTTGEMKDNRILFVVRRPVWERIGYKAKVTAEISKRGEINLVHNKILPPIVQEAVIDWANELVLEAEKAAPKFTPYVVSSNRHVQKPYRRRA